ncbi:COG1361 S-layer family protein, partial [Halococcus hamelinensis]
GASAAGGSQAAAGSGASAVSPDAEFDIVSVDSDVATGEPGTVSVTIENTGEDATDAVVNFQSGSGDLLFGQSASTSRYIGDWEEGESRTVDLSVQAAPGADSADYPVEASVSYEDDDGEAAQSASSTFGVTVDEASDDLSVTSVDSDVPVGGTGNVSVTLENTGEDATDAVVNLQTLSGDLLFDRSANATRYVGDWDAGESRTIEVTMQATPSADTDTYPVQASVSYDDSDGEAAQLGPATFGVTPESQQEFSLDDVSGDLEVGSSGTVTGTVTNDGPKDATDAVLTVSPNSTSDVIPRQSQYVLGDLDVDESTSFDLPVLVNDTTEPGERQVQYYVQYYDSDGDPLRSEALTATVDIDEQEDDFEVVSTSSDVETGEEGSLTVVMNNTGENVTDATVSFQSLSGGVLFGESANASQFVEDWDTGEERSFEFDVTATGSADTTYPMQASLQYTDSEDDGAQAGPFAFGVTPGESEDDFEVVSTDSNVQVGDEGPITLTLQNNGENATETTVSLQSLTGDITLGQTANATAFVGEWPTGAQRTVSFNATATNTTDVRDYPFQASVSYNDPDGDQASGGPFTVGVTPEPEQNFNLSNVESTLRVGSEGNVTAQVTNQGPQAIDNAVVQLESQSESLSPQETEAAVGSLAPGESANVSFPIEVPDSAESGARQLSFVVEYDNENGDTRRSGSLDTQVDVAGQRDSFIVERANASVGIGSSEAVTLNVTNNRDTVVTNLNAKAYADTPLSLSNDEAYIARLAPGESEQISFGVSVTGSASEGQYPLSVDFQYDTPSDAGQLSQEYNVPVEATESSGGGLLSSAPVMIGLAALLVVLGIGVVWSRR